MVLSMGRSGDGSQATSRDLADPELLREDCVINVPP